MTVVGSWQPEGALDQDQGLLELVVAQAIECYGDHMKHNTELWNLVANK